MSKRAFDHHVIYYHYNLFLLDLLKYTCEPPILRHPHTQLIFISYSFWANLIAVSTGRKSEEILNFR